MNVGVSDDRVSAAGGAAHDLGLAAILGGNLFARVSRTAERPCEARSAASRSSSRKSGGRSRPARAPRWCTVLPCSSAAPYSVTITSTWWRGVVITAPASNQGTIRERSSPPSVTVDGRQSSERSSSESAGAGDEVLVAADAGVLAAVDRVGDHLALDVDRERAR